VGVPLLILQTTFLTFAAGAVYCLAIKGNTLISGGSDGKYKVWDLTSYSCTRSKKAHVTLLCLKFDDELLVTAGIDAGNSFIKLWNVKDGVYLKAFAGHKVRVVLHYLIQNMLINKIGIYMVFGAERDKDSKWFS